MTPAMQTILRSVTTIRGSLVRGTPADVPAEVARALEACGDHGPAPAGGLVDKQALVIALDLAEDAVLDRDLDTAAARLRSLFTLPTGDDEPVEDEPAADDHDSEET